VLKQCRHCSVLQARFGAEGEQACARGWDALIGSLALSFAAARCAAWNLPSLALSAPSDPPDSVRERLGPFGSEPNRHLRAAQGMPNGAPGTALTSASVTFRKSVPLGRYPRTRPFVCPVGPRSHEW